MSGVEDLSFRRVDYLRIEVGADGVRQTFFLRSPEDQDRAGVEIRAELDLGGHGRAVEELGVDLAQRFGLPLRADLGPVDRRSVLTLEVMAHVVDVGVPEPYERDTME